MFFMRFYKHQTASVPFVNEGRDRSELERISRREARDEGGGGGEEEQCVYCCENVN